MKEELSIEKLNEIIKLMKENSIPPGLSGVALLTRFNGFDIYESLLMTETETYEDVETLTFRQRWIEPLLHFVTLPFEPWVKTRKVIKTRTIPSKRVLVCGSTMFIHPAMRRELVSALTNI